MSETLESPKPKAETHKTMGGKVNIYRRENSDNWQCSTFLNGHNWRVSTHEDSLGLRRRLVSRLARQGARRTSCKRDASARQEIQRSRHEIPRRGSHPHAGQRGPTWLNQYELKLNGVILPFLGEKHLAEITSGVIQEYRIWRAQNCKTGGAPARSTVHEEIVCIRQVLKTAGGMAGLSTPRHVRTLQDFRQNHAQGVVLTGGV